jgi:hypothetical protein
MKFESIAVALYMLGIPVDGTIAGSGPTGRVNCDVSRQMVSELIREGFSPVLTTQSSSDGTTARTTTIWTSRHGEVSVVITGQLDGTNISCIVAGGDKNTVLHHSIKN